MKANTKPSGFIKRMVGASMALFAASLLLVSCGLEDLMPDPNDSPECQNTKSQLQHRKATLAALTAALLDNPTPAEKEHYEHNIGRMNDQIAELEKQLAANNCK